MALTNRRKSAVSSISSSKFLRLYVTEIEWTVISILKFVNLFGKTSEYEGQQGKQFINASSNKSLSYQHKNDPMQR